MKKFALLATTFLACPALAQSAPETNRDPVHGDDDRVIIVTADFIDELDILAGTSVVTGDDLLRQIEPQIGDILVNQPGVSATSFSPGASRPVLRGLQGERVRVLTDGIGTLDVSNTSVDHAVTIDPLVTERIEIFRGPAALLFGSQAIGGAVNALDRRIPRAVPENGYHADAIGSYSSAYEGYSGSAAADIALGDQFVFHVDGSYRKTEDVEVGGYVLSPRLRAEQLAVAEEEFEEGHLEEAEEAQEFADRRGVLPNSATETYTLGAGFALINEGGSLGASVSYFDSRYGVPARPGAEHAHGEEGEEEHDDDHDDEEGHEEHGESPVTIDLKQYRADLRGEVFTGEGFLEKIKFRAGFSDYEHTEFEGDEVGTVFTTQGFETRLELVQNDRNGWRGVTGFQASTREFAAVGAEAFVPPNDTDQYGIFTLQEFEFGPIGLELSGRYEKTDVRSDSVAIGLEEDAVITAVDRNFNAFSIAGGVNYAIAPEVKLGLNLSRVERAPSAEELFSNGPHIATQAFEIGDPTLEKESSLGVEAYLRGETGAARFQLAAYFSRFDNFIYETDTGLEADGLPLFQFLQSDADYYGFEAQAAYDLIDRDGLTVTIDGVADYTRAEIDDDGPAPRIPALRVLGGVEASQDAFGARVEAEWVADQDRTASFEMPTDGYTMVNASVSWKPFGARNETMLILSGDNLFDVDARRHASFTKDFVPLAGRNIKLSARLSF
ncbi:TonB-dependent receptor [Erythrobacter sp. QSSC1-22B]|uniref:TonB-dependent receptor n=1 Tax=Erythrobacter sp. QSSC1-22B TaxID=1860125 RepID=UPI000805AFBC|nr:TonB-dependent receptor [Erythrobacter sp. QSSC1-22B]OBX19451.1 TonB-dependent receptor [Erythrobacter sp. QSSC1-22B]